MLGHKSIRHVWMLASPLLLLRRDVVSGRKSSVDPRAWIQSARLALSNACLRSLHRLDSHGSIPS